jgi:hypothetical protein
MVVSDVVMSSSVVAAAAAGITFDFNASDVGKACITSMENNTHYFPKGYRRPPSAESVPEPRANEVVVFEDFFIVGLHMPPHLALADILRKFWVQLHQLTLNVNMQINKFICVVSSCGGRLTVDVFAVTMSCIISTRKSISKAAKLPWLLSLDVSHSIPATTEAGQS